MVDQDANTIRALISRYADPKRIDKEKWKTFKSIEAEKIENILTIKLMIENRKPEIIDITENPDFAPSNWAEAFGIKKILALPLISQDQVIGTLIFDHIDEEKEFTTEQVELAQTIAGQIATTLENANLFDQALRRAERERHVAEITTKIRASNDPKIILHTALNELRRALKKPKVKITEQSDSET
jgi:transcriptional regulator with GAF, ATPase, and Fis domain